MEKIETKCCKICGKIKPTSDFYNKQSMCKLCNNVKVRKMMNDKNKMPEFRSITKTKSAIKKLKGKLEHMKNNGYDSLLKCKQITIPLETYKKMVNDVFQNKSFLGIINIPSQLQDKKSNRLMLWWINLKEPLTEENMFVCSEPEFDFIVKYNFGDTLKALETLFPNNTKEQNEEIIKKLRQYDEKKKELGLIKKRKSMKKDMVACKKIKCK